jgi:hypothetical protein
MTEATKTRRAPPPQPRVGMFVAIALELAMLSTFIANRSVVGCALFVLYFYFSATCAALFDAYGDRDDP